MKDGFKNCMSGKDIVFSHVNKSYGDKCVLNDLCVTFEKGRIHCIMGESGVGKTTLLRLVMGLEKAEGIVEGAGVVSAVFQENRLVDDISAVDNIRLVLGNADTTGIEAELLKLLPKDCIHQSVSELSGGMQRRVAIVRAMMKQGNTLCLDEPFTGLDDDNKANVYNYIKEGLKGRTALIVTHSKEEAKALDAKIYLLTSSGAVATIMGDCE